MLYKYPHREFPYTQLVQANRRRGRHEPEYELLDTGVLDDDRYFDVFVEYAKAAPDDILMRLTMHNRGPETAEIHVLPQLWFRNTWSWSDVQTRPRLEAIGNGTIEADHSELGRFRCQVDPPPHWLFCDNETNPERVHGLAGVQGHFQEATDRSALPQLPALLRVLSRRHGPRRRCFAPNGLDRLDRHTAPATTR
jgi:hypothetical protein